MGQDANILVTGAGGFIGHHLTRYLVAKGYFVRGVDVKFPSTSCHRPRSSASSTCAAGRTA
jgi:nucleoside-diphosphate-sugar epimerase